MGLETSRMNKIIPEKTNSSTSRTTKNKDQLTDDFNNWNHLLILTFGLSTFESIKELSSELRRPSVSPRSRVGLYSEPQSDIVINGPWSIKLSSSSSLACQGSGNKDLEELSVLELNSDQTGLDKSCHKE